MKKIVKIEERKEKIRGRVIDCLAVGSNGKLVSTALDNIVGADLSVEFRGEYYNEVKIYLKIIECDKGGQFFRADIAAKDIIVKPNFYFLFVNFDLLAQDISQYVWLAPVKLFLKLLEINNIDEVKSIGFEAPADPKNQGKYARYLLEKKALGGALIKIITQGERFLFPQAGFSLIENFKEEDLKKFIVEARRNTFAANAVPSDNPRIRGTKELEYQRGEWFYRDSYFSGKKDFSGQEIVYYNQRPVWNMSYSGQNLPDKEEEFLKFALLRSADKCRFGQQCQIKRLDFSYEDNGSGDMKNFSGQEIIKGKNTYIINYKGGLLDE